MLSTLSNTEVFERLLPVINFAFENGYLLEHEANDIGCDLEDHLIDEQNRLRSMIAELTEERDVLWSSVNTAQALLLAEGRGDYQAWRNLANDWLAGDDITEALG